MSERPETPRLRSVKVDPYAISDLARECRLTANEAFVLFLLAIRAEYRSAEWAGTLTDLSDASRLSRKTITSIVDSLVTKGQLEIVDPFRQGYRDGRVRVLERNRLVRADARSKTNALNVTISESGDRAYLAPSLSLDRAENAYSNAIDQGERGDREVLRQRGTDEVPVPSGHCGECGDPIAGHPFNDHDPHEGDGNEPEFGPCAERDIGTVIMDGNAESYCASRNGSAG